MADLQSAPGRAQPEQREAVAAVEGPLLILAGAGSGKTRVITHRIAHLVLDRGVPSEHDPGGHLHQQGRRARCARGSSGCSRGRRCAPGSRPSTASACASCGARRRGGPAAGLPDLRRGRPARGREGGAARARPLREAAPAAAPALAHLGRSRTRAGRAREQRRRPRRELDRARRASATQRSCSAAGALDFDDLLLRARTCSAGNAAVRERWQRRFPYVLVDEYQDTNRAQYELVRLLAGPGGNLTVVGDEDQSIYSWRGADIHNILDFESDFPGAHVFRLEENYRSTPERSSTSPRRSSRTTCGARARRCARCATGGEPVRLHEALDEFEEAAWVVERTARLRDARPGRRPHADERAEPAARGRPAARADPVPGRGRRRLLRAARGEGRPRLPAAGAEPARRGRAAPRHQRAAARDRRRRRSTRSSGPRPRARSRPGTRSCGSPTTRRCPAARSCRCASSATASRTLRARGPGARRPAAARAHARAHRLRGGTRTRGLAGEPGAAREPGGAARRRRRLRAARGGAEPRGLPRPRGARLRDGPPARRRAGAC